VKSGPKRNHCKRADFYFSNYAFQLPFLQLIVILVAIWSFKFPQNFDPFFSCWSFGFLRPISTQVGSWLMKVTLAQPSGEVPTSYNNIQDGLELPGALGLLINVYWKLLQSYCSTQPCTQAIAHCCRMEDDAMGAKTIWLLFLCFSCKVVMAFERFDDSQVCWTYYISSLEAVGLSISIRLFTISNHLEGVGGPKINGHTHLSGTSKVQVYHSLLRGVNWCWVGFIF
jgi:hypothetical protein